jgi:hypothetical protein
MPGRSACTLITTGPADATEESRLRSSADITAEIAGLQSFEDGDMVKALNMVGEGGRGSQMKASYIRSEIYRQNPTANLQFFVLDP